MFKTGVLAVTLASVGLGCVVESEDETLDETTIGQSSAALVGAFPIVSEVKASFWKKKVKLGSWCGSWADAYVSQPDPAYIDANYPGMKFPVFIYTVGTGGNYDALAAREFVDDMASRGFVAASVDYGTEVPFTCGAWINKAKCAFDSGRRKSATKKLCGLAQADCSKGIVTSGMSQGSWVAMLAKNYDSRVRATVALSGGHSVLNLLNCPTTNVPPSREGTRVLADADLLIINGRNDNLWGSQADMISQLQDLTGRSCSYDPSNPDTQACLDQSMGDGYAVLSNTDGFLEPDNEAAHGFMIVNKDTNNCTWQTCPTDSYWRWEGCDPHTFSWGCWAMRNGAEVFLQDRVD